MNLYIFVSYDSCGGPCIYQAGQNGKRMERAALIRELFTEGGGPSPWLGKDPIRALIKQIT